MHMWIKDLFTDYIIPIVPAAVGGYFGGPMGAAAGYAGGSMIGKALDDDDGTGGLRMDALSGEADARKQLREQERKLEESRRKKGEILNSLEEKYAEINSKDYTNPALTRFMPSSSFRNTQITPMSAYGYGNL